MQACVDRVIAHAGLLLRASRRARYFPRRAGLGYWLRHSDRYLGWEAYGLSTGLGVGIGTEGGVRSQYWPAWELVLRKGYGGTRVR
eukprot:3377603-Rhodomonas_salina.1